LVKKSRSMSGFFFGDGSQAVQASDGAQSRVALRCTQAM
jgi:hypothetical protein